MMRTADERQKSNNVKTEDFLGEQGQKID